MLSIYNSWVGSIQGQVLPYDVYQGYANFLAKFQVKDLVKKIVFLGVSIRAGGVQYGFHFVLRETIHNLCAGF